MKVLGISPLDKDSTVTFVEDGRIVYAAGEERFTRVKLQDGFPWQSLQDGMEFTGWAAEEIDEVSYAFLPWDEETRLFTKSLEEEARWLGETESADTQRQIKEALGRVPKRSQVIPGLGDPNERMEKSLVKNLAYRVLASESLVSRNVARRGSDQWGQGASNYHKKWHEELENGLADVGLLPKLKRYEHHETHSANAYFTSGFDEAVIITLDGYGSGLAGSASLGRGGEITRLHGIKYPHSLGTFYESVTSGLGFKPSRHEGKIVGLAAYGDPYILRDLLLSRFDQEPGDFRIKEANNIYFVRMLASQFPKIDVAAAYQHVLEVVATAYVAHYVKQTGVKNVVLSGGVVANVKLNQRIKEIPGVEKIFIHPDMGDGGCGTGAALLPFIQPGKTWAAVKDVYLGPEYSDKQIEDALRTARLPFDHYPTIEPKIAQLIASGKVVARFNGRMEYGPRALGNRSILYHAHEPEVNQWLNQRLGRTEFMPFAPATLSEHRHECYKNIDGAEYAAQFMTVTFDCTEKMRKDSPAAVHVDGTARPQLVTPESNPSFHAVLTEFHKLTGVPSVINTSFNMHEEPIVCAPDDAIRAFLQGNLEYLAMGPYLVAHPSSRR
ncbi:putative carbamoyl transferase, NodU family [Luteitalea pratensis]|uniref:Putative carbamoyl transferase, NodU family n=1 Tax=Luteitalea pratensis TaxID=1855912 RepID=A0A143PN71_LUTPR|nr:carbamoyltransferase C-terminal domain-containing protein [Luteitalea pratensis]AMY10087.1 putative carbamoyl transferase, NodU family [Luteitalea pratensis]